MGAGDRACGFGVEFDACYTGLTIPSKVSRMGPGSGVPISGIGSVSLRPRELSSEVVQMRRRLLLEGGLGLPWDSRPCVTQGVVSVGGR